MTKLKRQKIMIVDDNMAMLNMGKKMLREQYEVYALPSSERLFSFLGVITPDLILMDVSMPEMSGFEVFKILKSNAQYADIPVIFVTSKDKETDELEGLALGAVDYVTKPFSAAILLKRIENHLLIRKQKAELKEFNDNLIAMVKKKTTKITGLQRSIIETLAEIVEFRDEQTGGHIYRTQQYVRLILQYLNEHDTVYSEEVLTWGDMDSIVASTQLHDLGKINISDAILNKRGRLTPEEYDMMKSHTTKGVEIIKTMKTGGDAEQEQFLRYAEIVAATHHEKWDGSGYPAGLKRLGIPLLGRMMAIADVYDALVSIRSYKKAFSTEEAAKIILKQTGKYFDPFLVAVFMELESEFAAIAGRQDAGDHENAPSMPMEEA